MKLEFFIRTPLDVDSILEHTCLTCKFCHVALGGEGEIMCGMRINIRQKNETNCKKYQYLRECKKL